MSYSIEYLHVTISRKIDKLVTYVAFIHSQDNAHAACVERAAEIDDQYQINVVDIMVEYYTSQSPATDCKYLSILRGLNIDNRIMECVNMCSILGLRPAAASTAIKMAAEISSIVVDIKIAVDEYEYCCQSKMEILTDSSQLYCGICSRILNIKGMVFEDAQFYSQDGKKTKHGKYDPIKNFHNWLARILAREKIKLTRPELTSIGNCIKRDGFGEPGSAHKLTLRDIRAYLQELDLTNANNGAAYLLAIFSGVRPPQLTASEYDEITSIYKIVVSIYAEEREGPNTPYCPFFIYKIIEERWGNDPEKRRLLNYIHLKKFTTVSKWENHWERIMKRRGGGGTIQP